MRPTYILLFLVFVCACNPQDKPEKQDEPEKLKALIIDGSNNHYIWPKGTAMMKDYLHETDLFEVSVYRMDSIWLGIKYNKARSEPLEFYINEFPVDQETRSILADPAQETDFSIDFSKYDVIISNLGAKSPNWSDETKRAFDDYLLEGGGFVVVHAANNAWGDWDEFNEMIGLGAWGDRDSTSGPFVYYDENGRILMDSSDQVCGSHGNEHEYLVTAREQDHPILNGLPPEWMHTQDELYDRMRGPFKNATILATAYSDAEINAQSWEPVLPGTGQHVPVLMSIKYGNGRIFHTTLGHFDYSMECIGFITTLQRGAEWAATGQVTQPVPSEFPTPDETRSRKWSVKSQNMAAIGPN